MDYDNDRDIVADKLAGEKAAKRFDAQCPPDSKLFRLFQLGEQAFPKIRTKRRKTEVITLEQREKLVALRCVQVAAGIQVETLGQSWIELVK